MARMRTLKPSFFANDVLTEIHPLGRLLFQGLWCLADREGRLEDRAKRIKVEILPYDKVDVDRLLAALAERGFILRYEIDGARYIQVVNFLKHQNPHVNEAPSIIPAPEEHGTPPVPTPPSRTNGHHTAPSSRAGVPGHGIPVQEQSPVRGADESPAAPPSQSPKLRVLGEPVPKPARSTTPVGMLIDKIRAIDHEIPIYGDQAITGKKLRENPETDLDLVAEAYVSFRHGEWPGTKLLRESGGLAWVIGDVGGYVAWKTQRLRSVSLPPDRTGVAN